ncbi:MAG: hypothetical protein ACI4M4_08215 [Candidatus Ornithospirochaeta sp.]
MSRENFLLIFIDSNEGFGIQFLETLSQGPDHPQRLSFPESQYLKGFVLRVIK